MATCDYNYTISYASDNTRYFPVDGSITGIITIDGGYIGNSAPIVITSAPIVITTDGTNALPINTPNPYLVNPIPAIDPKLWDKLMKMIAEESKIEKEEEVPISRRKRMIDI